MPVVLDEHSSLVKLYLKHFSSVLFPSAVILLFLLRDEDSLNGHFTDTHTVDKESIFHSH